MHNITEEEIDFILDDIQSRGVTLEDLQENLLDHVCCIIENEKHPEEDFYKFYESILPRFFKKDLKEIQEETEKLLIFKNYYTMIRILKIVGIVTAIITLLGAIFKTFHWPGAGLFVLLSGVLLSVVFLPLLITLKLRDEKNSIDKWVLTFGLLIGMGAAMGILFKIMHWPYAGSLMRWSITFFVFLYVPLYYFTRIRRAELRLNTTVNTVLMMACGGLLYAMFNLNHNDFNHQEYQFMLKTLSSETTHLRTQNEQLLLANKSTEALAFHEQSEQLYNRLSKIKHVVLNGEDSKSVDRELEHYNTMLYQTTLPKETIKRLWIDNVALPQFIEQISVAQKQIAVNEHTFLNSINKVK